MLLKQNKKFDKIAFFGIKKKYIIYIYNKILLIDRFFLFLMSKVVCLYVFVLFLASSSHF